MVLFYNHFSNLAISNLYIDAVSGVSNLYTLEVEVDCITFFYCDLFNCSSSGTVN